MAAATKSEIGAWFDKGLKENATHMVVAHDSFDHEDYSIYVMKDENVREKATSIGGMQKIMEVYNLSMDKDKQLEEDKAFNY